MKAQDVETVLKALLLKDLRTQCRSRALSPAGGKEALIERLRDEMLKSSDYTLKTIEGGVDKQLTEKIMGRAAMRDTRLVNNYLRPDGQNVGNFITDRTSSRVLAPPGGGSQISLSMDSPKVPQKVKVEVPPQRPSPPQKFVAPPVARPSPPKFVAPKPAAAPPPAPATPPPPPAETKPSPEPETAPSPVPAKHILVAPYGVSDSAKETTNNYARPGGMQNVGNFITDRNTSRVIAPPGGHTHVTLG